jgi:hypothetical protein
MKFKNWMIAGALGVFLLSVNPAATLAQDNDNGHGHGNGKGHGKGHNKHDDDDEQSERYYKHQHEEAARNWYYQNEGHLPPGLAKRDRLPPGLEKQLVLRGTLPPGLQKKIQPVPVDLERCLPPPPPDCMNVLIGGHIVLVNQRTNFVVDIFHFEVN